MERMGPELLRKFADELEDERSMENVESCRRVPSLDQKMLLALNKPYGESEDMHLPDAGDVLSWLGKVLVSVETSDQQNAALGAFYTNIDPLNLRGIGPWHDAEKRVVAVGIFPRYNEITKYTIKPYIDAKSWESKGKITVSDGATAAGVDPFLLPNPEQQSSERDSERRPHLIFFQKNPFNEEHPYRTEIDESSWHLPLPTLQENALEENIIDRAQFHVDHGRKPRLFTQEGFTRFIGRNREDQKYAELYAASKSRRLVGTSPMHNY